MGQPQYLIDTNAIADYLGNNLPPTGMTFMSTVINEMPLVSVITKIELLGFSAPDEYYQLLSDLMFDVSILELTEAVVNQSISIRKRNKIKTPDAIIAATALVFNLSLITRNLKDFANIKGLKVVNPWEYNKST